MALPAALGVAALALTACTSTSGGSGSTGSAGSTPPPSSAGGPTSPPASGPAPSTSISGSPSTSASTSTAPAAQPVHIKLLNSDGSEYGVGMPVIAYFSKRITSAVALQKATTVTVNGKKATGGWYFETSAAGNGPIEAHLRLPHYWPANAKVFVNIPAKGLSAGRGLAYDDSLTLSFTTGPANIVTVSNAEHEVTVVSNGKRIGRYPTSLGATGTPTARGIKVIMEKGLDISMSGPGYDDPHVKYTQRLTYGGEYLHSAPWNTENIDHGINSSNGCTNLLPADAVTLYHLLRVGDVVQYPDANGKQMQLGQGYGDWNLSWAQWRTGGLVPTTA